MVELARVDPNDENLFYRAGQGFRNYVAPIVPAAGAAFADVYSTAPRAIASAAQNLYRGATAQPPVPFQALPFSRGLRTAPAAPTAPELASTTAASPAVTPTTGLRQPATTAPTSGLRQPQAVLEPAPMAADSVGPVAAPAQRERLAMGVRGNAARAPYYSNYVNVPGSGYEIGPGGSVSTFAPRDVVASMDELAAKINMQRAQTGLYETQANLAPLEAASQAGLRRAQTSLANTQAATGRLVPTTYEIPNPSDPYGPPLQQQLLVNQATGEVIDPQARLRQQVARQAPQEALDLLLSEPSKYKQAFRDYYGYLPEGVE